MASLLSSMIVRIGSRMSDAVAANAAIDATKPLVAWTLPPGIRQVRASVKITNCEMGGFAFVTSGPVATTDPWWMIPPGQDLDANLNGLCSVDVAISANATGDFEYQAPTTYFVFQRELQRLYNPNDLLVKFHKPVNPDGLPEGQPWKYWIQIDDNPLFFKPMTLELTGQLLMESGDPLSLEPIYDDSVNIQIPDTNGNAYITHDWQTDQTVPAFSPTQPPAPLGHRDYGVDHRLLGPLSNIPRNAPYFYRVSAWDGLDWSPWSITNAFWSYNDDRPVFRFVSFTPTGNDYGDIQITFQVIDADSKEVSAEISFQGGPNSGDPVPVELIESTCRFTPGYWTVTWRAGRQLLRALNDGIVLFGRAYDGHTFSETDRMDSISVNLSNLPDPHAGFGSALWNYPINLGHLSLPAPAQQAHDDYPAMVQIYGTKVPEQDMYPVVLGKYIWRNMYLVCPPETWQNSNGTILGFGHNGIFAQYYTDWWSPPLHDDSVHSMFWPVPIAQFNVQNGSKWTDMSPKLDQQNLIPIPVTSHAFLFLAPVDVTKPDTLPLPIPSREWDRQPFLRGYTDLNGVAKGYPNDYDWNHRPDWHIGREVWDKNDAWVQVGHVKYTQYISCSTCKGRDWVASAGPPYRRVPCTNPNCVGGFDTTMPYTASKGTPGQIGYKQWLLTSQYIDVTWWRMSAFLQKEGLDTDRRFGLNIAGAQYAKGVQWIVGRQVSTLDADLFDPTTGAPTQYEPLIDRLRRTLPVVNYTVTIGTGDNQEQFNRSLTVEWDPVTPSTSDIQTQTLAHNPAVTIVLRQDDSIDVAGYAKPPATNPATIITQDYPAAVGSIKTTTDQSQELPTAGHLSIGISNFTMKGVNPNSSTLAGARKPSTQEGSIAVRGTLERNYIVQKLDFRFLPAWWDAYNTLHVSNTGSATSKFQVQYAKINPDSSFGQWLDVQGDNAVFDPELKGWTCDALKFYEFWDTSIVSLLPDGTDFKIRVRQWDPATHTVTEWIYSHTVTALRGVTNPVNMVSMVWEPWAQTVTVTFRLDSTHGDAYNLTAFRYSNDDGNTWTEISRGDIYGSVTNLVSGDGDGNVIEHVIVWNAISYNLIPSDNYRIQIECLPTQFAEDAVLPYFRWFTPQNPGIDEAERIIGNVVGRQETLRFNGTQWVALPKPVFSPGQLYYDQIALENIRSDPGHQISAPNGIYSFITPGVTAPYPSGAIPDASGAILFANVPNYQLWLNETYQTGETRGAAMQRINVEIQNLITVVVPNAQVAVLNGEKNIRKNLIRQGYYAEQYFQGAIPNVVESVLADVVADNGLNQASQATQVMRQWAFRVQGSPIGSSAVDQANGQFNPFNVTTTLERVFYKVQLDPHAAYDSQQYGTPLREFLYNYDGQRLTVATFYGGRPIVDYQANPSLQAFNGSNQSDYPIVTIGGTMKIKPNDLPGQHPEDMLPFDMSAWDGNYSWRVAAYNAFPAANLSQARPQIAALTSTPGGLLTISFSMHAHSNVQTAALKNTVDGLGITHYNGLEVSSTFLAAPVWQAVDDPSAPATLINFVSDRRSPTSAFATSSTIPWIPRGTNRPHPYLFWDADKQMYMMYNSKISFDGTSWRVINSRMMSIPQVCEYESYFQDDSSLAIYRPCVVKAMGQYWMFVSVQPPQGSAYIGVATSTDAESWASVQPIAFAANGIDPSVWFDGTTFHLFYEIMSGGKVQVAYAQSTDGYGFIMQNGGVPVYGETGNVTCPSVVFNRGSWIMYFNDAVGNIASVFSYDAVHWSGRQVEIGPVSMKINQGDLTPTALTPRNPAIFIDAYGGNQELLMVFNYQTGGGQNYVYVARLEDRVWIPAISNKIYTLDDPFNAVASSRGGVSHRFAMDLNAHGVQATDPIKIRMHFGAVYPSVIEYHRQSEWVDFSTLTDDDYLDPAPYYPFNSALLEFPYMRLQ